MIKKDKRPRGRLRFGYAWLGVTILSLTVFIPALGAESQKQGSKVFHIAGNGVAQCVIVQAADQTDPEKEAVADLKTYLEKITGAEFSVITEKDVVSGKPSIYVGLTDFAVKSGFDFPKFGEEEYA